MVGVLGDPSLQDLGQFAQFALRRLAFTDVSGNEDVDALSTHGQGGRGDLDGNVPAIQAPDDPFEAMALSLFDEGDDLRRRVGGARAIGLNRGRNVLGPGAQQLPLVLRANQLDRGLVAVQQGDGLGVVQPDGIRAALEQALEHGASLPQRQFGRTGSFVPFLVRGRRFHARCTTRLTARWATVPTRSNVASNPPPRKPQQPSKAWWVFSPIPCGEPAPGPCLQST
jgi:hypothetical protein